MTLIINLILFMSDQLIHTFIISITLLIFATPTYLSPNTSISDMFQLSKGRLQVARQILFNSKVNEMSYRM